MPDKSDNSSFAAVLSVVGVAAATIGIAYNVGYFFKSNINYMTLLDYSDFLYTPFLLLGPALGAALIIAASRTYWQERQVALFLDVALSVIVVAVNGINQFLGLFSSTWGHLLLVLSLGICLIWMGVGAAQLWRSDTWLPEFGSALALGYLGFLGSSALYAAQQASTDLTCADFRDQLILKDNKTLGAVHIARIVGKGVLVVTQGHPKVLMFYRSDAYDALALANSTAPPDCASKKDAQ